MHGWDPWMAARRFMKDQWMPSCFNAFELQISCIFKQNQLSNKKNIKDTQLFDAPFKNTIYLLVIKVKRLAFYNILNMIFVLYENQNYPIKHKPNLYPRQRNQISSLLSHLYNNANFIWHLLHNLSQMLKKFAFKIILNSIIALLLQIISIINNYQQVQNQPTKSENIMLIKDTLSRILSTQNLGSQHLSQQNQKINQLYKIKISDLTQKSSHNQSERNVYLNLTFSDQQRCAIQTQCIDILSSANHYKIQTIKDLAKIQVIEYDSMKKLAKVSLKGVQKQFQYSFEQKRSKISVQIQRTIYSQISQKKKPVSDKLKTCEETAEYYKLSHSTNESFDHKNDQEKVNGDL